jgi:hypothetical protein
VVHVVEHLSNKCKDLISNSSTAKKEEEEEIDLTLPVSLFFHMNLSKFIIDYFVEHVVTKNYCNQNIENKRSESLIKY